jgi:hypothetical protein
MRAFSWLNLISAFFSTFAASCAESDRSGRPKQRKRRK